MKVIEKKLTYKRYAIAYMDILGTKDAIMSETPNILLERFDTVFTMVDLIIKKELGFEENSDDIKIKIFSDNICVAQEIKKGEDESSRLVWLAVRCRNFQRNIFTSYGRLLIRGGITVGDLYIDDNFVLGPGLIEAYKMENEYAKYPRIIIDRRYTDKVTEILKDYFRQINNGTAKCPIVKDDDGLYFLDFLEPDPYGIDESIEETHEWIRQDEDNLNMITRDEKECLKSKFDWLRNYHQKIKDLYAYKGENT